MAIERKTLGEVSGVTLVLADSTLADRFSRDEMLVAFNLATANLADWKMPIDAVIPAGMRAAAAAGIEFFTGSEATFSEETDAFVRVTAPGYYGATGA